MKKYIYLLAIILCLGCGRRESRRLLFVSVEPQRAILEEIVGDKYEVETILTPGMNPETFEPGIKARRKLESATAYFPTGMLPFEQKLATTLGNRLPIVSTTAGIEPVYGTHSHNHGDDGHGHSSEGNKGEADPHVWTSVKNARLMAAEMVDFLKNTDPDNAGFYQANYLKLSNRLDSLDKAFALTLSQPDVQKSFAIWHPSLSYFARDYDLEQIAVGFENKEMPASKLKQIIEEARQDSVKVFFFQQEFDNRQAKTINAEMGTRLVTINPLDYDWEEQLRVVVSELCR